MILPTSSQKSNLICHVCQKDAPYRCERCHIGRYCSKLHQAQDWKRHHLVCEDEEPILWDRCLKIINATESLLKFCLLNAYLKKYAGFLFVRGSKKKTCYIPLGSKEFLVETFDISFSEKAYDTLKKVVCTTDIKTGFTILFQDDDQLNYRIYVMRSSQYIKLYASVSKMPDELVNHCLKDLFEKIL